MLDAAHYLFWKVALKRGAVAELTAIVAAPALKRAVSGNGSRKVVSAGNLLNVIHHFFRS